MKFPFSKPAGGLLLALPLTLGSLPAAAVDYRSVEAPVAVLYDAPSQKGKKLYLVKTGTPLEVVVRLEGWNKVRDAEGGMSWVETRHLGDTRRVVVTAPRASLRSADRDDAPLVLEADKWVSFDLLEPASPGWIKVRHRDGASGFIRVREVWGL